MTGSKKTALFSVLLAILLGWIAAYFVFPEGTYRLLLKAGRSLAGLEQQVIDLEGMHIEYLEGGQGQVLLLLHGFGGSKDNWTRIGRYLTPHFRVIAPDLPGFGESTRDAGADYTVLMQAERVKRFVRALGIRSFHLGGNSMGGSIAGTYAAKYTSDVISLWLISPAGVVRSQESEMFHRLNTGMPNPLISKNMEEYELLLDFLFHKKPYVPHPVKVVLARNAISRQPLRREIFGQLINAMDGAALEVTLAGLTTPTLIVWGAEDRVLHVSGASILESVLPEGKAVVMEETGHIPVIEKPEETAKLYLRFLNLTDSR
jgi:pimeloyl-ACP methyl ester carboxylesterase